VRTSTSGGKSSRVDSFNEELIQQMLHKHKQSTASSVGTGSLADSAIGSYTGYSSTLSHTSVITRRLAWVRHMVGDRGAHSQDCVTPPPATSSIDEESVGLRGSGIGGASNVEHQRLTVPADFGRLDKELAHSSSWPLLGMHLNYEADQVTLLPEWICNDAAPSEVGGASGSFSLHRKHSQPQSSRYS